MQTIRRWIGWHQIYDINYTDQILRSIVKTTYAKQKLSGIVLMLLTVLVRLHVDAILSLMINFNNIYIDFWIQIFISIILVIKSGWIYKIVEKFDREVYGMTRYLVNNYSDVNYRQWKAKTTFLICVYLVIYLSFVEINSTLLRIYIIQYLICYIIIEIIERKSYIQAFSIFNTKSPIFTYIDDDFEIVQFRNKKTTQDTISPNSTPPPSPSQSIDSQSKVAHISHRKTPPKILNDKKIFILTDDFVLNEK
jgi:hypothetical protein